MGILVNGQPMQPGCYVDGHYGQYAPDMLGDIVHGIFPNLPEDRFPAYWRAEAARTRGGYAWERAMDAFHECADNLTDLLNDSTEGGFWEWRDGEVFLTENCGPHHPSSKCDYCDYL